MKAWFYFMATGLVVLLLYIGFGSWHFIKPVSMEYRDGVLRYVREVPFGDVWARVPYEVRTPGRPACRPDFPPIIPFEDVGLQEVLVRFPEEVLPCVPGPDGLFVLDLQRQVLVAGWFPLFPDRTIWSCHVDLGRCEMIRR